MGKKSGATMPWTEKDLNELVAKGNIRSWQETGRRGPVLPPELLQAERKKGRAQKKKLGLPEKEPVAVTHMRSVLFNSGVAFAEEHRFHPERKWRFDFCIPSLLWAFEYEGIMSEKSRHTSIVGYSGDAEKYSQAALLGWRILRYTVLNVKNFEQDLQTILNQDV